jgi:hypothetical protein
VDNSKSDWIGNELGQMVLRHMQCTAYTMEAYFCAMGALAGEYAYRHIVGENGPAKWHKNFEPWSLVYETRPGCSNTDTITFATGVVRGIHACKSVSDFDKMSVEVRLLGTVMDTRTAILAEASPLDYIWPNFLEIIWAPEQARQLRTEVDAFAKRFEMDEAMTCLMIGVGVGNTLNVSESRLEHPPLHFAKLSLDYAALFSMFPPIGGFSPLSSSPSQTSPLHPSHAPKKKAPIFGRRNLH